MEEQRQQSEIWFKLQLESSYESDCLVDMNMCFINRKLLRRTGVQVRRVSKEDTSLVWNQVSVILDLSYDVQKQYCIVRSKEQVVMVISLIDGIVYQSQQSMIFPNNYQQIFESKNHNSNVEICRNMIEFKEKKGINQQIRNRINYLVNNGELGGYILESVLSGSSVNIKCRNLFDERTVYSKYERAQHHGRSIVELNIDSWKVNKLGDEYVVDYKGQSQVYDEKGECYDNDKKQLELGTDLMVYDVEKKQVMIRTSFKLVVENKIDNNSKRLDNNRKRLDNNRCSIYQSQIGVEQNMLVGRLEDGQGCQYIQGLLDNLVGLSQSSDQLMGQQVVDSFRMLVLTDNRAISSVLLIQMLSGKGTIYCQSKMVEQQIETNQLIHNYYSIFKNNLKVEEEEEEEKQEIEEDENVIRLIELMEKQEEYREMQIDGWDLDEAISNDLKQKQRAI